MNANNSYQATYGPYYWRMMRDITSEGWHHLQKEIKSEYDEYYFTQAMKAYDIQEVGVDGIQWRAEAHIHTHFYGTMELYQKNATSFQNTEGIYHKIRPYPDALRLEKRLPRSEGAEREAPYAVKFSDKQYDLMIATINTSFQRSGTSLQRRPTIYGRRRVHLRLPRGPPENSHDSEPAANEESSLETSIEKTPPPVLPRRKLLCDNCFAVGHRWMECLRHCSRCGSKQHKLLECGGQRMKRKAVETLQKEFEAVKRKRAREDEESANWAMEMELVYPENPPDEEEEEEDVELSFEKNCRI